jgi:hypothetical protein
MNVNEFRNALRGVLKEELAIFADLLMNGEWNNRRLRAAGGGAPPMRKMACESCRQSKRRCDGKHPCHYCIADGRRCKYPRTFYGRTSSAAKRARARPAAAAAGAGAAFDEPRHEVAAGGALYDPEAVETAREETDEPVPGDLPEHEVETPPPSSPASPVGVGADGVASSSSSEEEVPGQRTNSEAQAVAARLLAAMTAPAAHEKRARAESGAAAPPSKKGRGANPRAHAKRAKKSQRKAKPKA